MIPAAPRGGPSASAGRQASPRPATIGRPSGSPGGISWRVVLTSDRRERVLVMAEQDLRFADQLLARRRGRVPGLSGLAGASIGRRPPPPELAQRGLRWHEHAAAEQRQTHTDRTHGPRGRSGLRPFHSACGGVYPTAPHASATLHLPGPAAARGWFLRYRPLGLIRVHCVDRRAGDAIKFAAVRQPSISERPSPHPRPAGSVDQARSNHPPRKPRRRTTRTARLWRAARVVVGRGDSARRADTFAEIAPRVSRGAVRRLGWATGCAGARGRRRRGRSRRVACRLMTTRGAQAPTISARDVR